MLTKTAAIASPNERRPIFIIGPLGPSPWVHLRSAWRNRYLMGPLCYLALAVTYRFTILGWWWLIIRVTLPTLGLIVIFQHIGSLQPRDLPYPLFVISGMSLWTILGVGLTQGTRRMRIVRGISFRLALPKILALVAGMALPGVYALGFLLLLFGGIAYYYATSGTLFIGSLWQLAFFPVSLLLAGMLTVGILAVTSVVFLVARDVRMFTIFLVQCWFYFTPIIYPLDVLPKAWRGAVLFLNPMAPLIELSRWSLLGTGTLHLPSLLTASAVCLGVFWLGLCFMSRAEVAIPLLPVK